LGTTNIVSFVNYFYSTGALGSTIAYDRIKPIGFTCAFLAKDNSDRFHVAKITY
jgi:hypothetical protein